MRVTMKEIAERAGVHQATVDKVVHNRVGVSDEVRAKVQAIIDELGYKPNPTVFCSGRARNTAFTPFWWTLTRCRTSKTASSRV